MVLIVKKLEGWLFMSKKGYSGTPTHSPFCFRRDGSQSS